MATLPVPAGGLPIAVIDGYEAVRVAVSRLLRAAGYDAGAYGSAEEFLCASVRPSALVVALAAADAHDQPVRQLAVLLPLLECSLTPSGMAASLRDSATGWGVVCVVVKAPFASRGPA